MTQVVKHGNEIDWDSIWESVRFQIESSDDLLYTHELDQSVDEHFATLTIEEIATFEDCRRNIIRTISFNQST